jgi:hypothetical protein
MIGAEMIDALDNLPTAMQSLLRVAALILTLHLPGHGTYRATVRRSHPTDQAAT